MLGIVVILNILWAPVNEMITLARGTGFSPMGIGFTRWITLSILLTFLLQFPGFRKFCSYQSMAKADWLKSILIGFFLFGPSHLLYYSSMGQTSTVEGSVMLTTGPLWVAILAYFILKDEVMTLKRWAAIGLSFVGAYIVVVGFKIPDMMGHTKGNLMFGLGVILESLMGVFAAKISRRTSGVSVLVGQMWGGALVFSVGALLLRSQLPLVVPTFTFANFYPMFYLIIISGIITFTIWYRIVEKSPLTLLMVVVALQPPVAALLTWAIHKQAPTVNSIIGAVVIFAALILGFVGEKADLKPTMDPFGPSG